MKQIGGAFSLHVVAGKRSSPHGSLALSSASVTSSLDVPAVSGTHPGSPTVPRWLEWSNIPGDPMGHGVTPASEVECRSCLKCRL